MFLVWQVIGVLLGSDRMRVLRGVCEALARLDEDHFRIILGAIQYVEGHNNGASGLERHLAAVEECRKVLREYPEWLIHVGVFAVYLGLYRGA